MAKPRAERANVQPGLLHPAGSALSCPDDVFGRHMVLETGRREGAGVLHLENLKVFELARYVSKKKKKAFACLDKSLILNQKRERLHIGKELKHFSPLKRTMNF